MLFSYKVYNFENTIYCTMESVRHMSQLSLCRVRTVFDWGYKQAELWGSCSHVEFLPDIFGLGDNRNNR